MTRLIVSIEVDENSESPREWDNLGVMVCWHSKYILGDDQPQSEPKRWMEELAERFDIDGRLEYWSDRVTDACTDAAEQRAEDRYQKAMEQIISHKVVMLPLFLYDHSGITMSVKPYPCCWDSGQVGYIYVTLNDVRKEYGCQRVSAKCRKEVEDLLVTEVGVYDQYLRGDVYGFTVESNDEIVDSCWGYYGRSEVEAAVIDAMPNALSV